MKNAFCGLFPAEAKRELRAGFLSFLKAVTLWRTGRKRRWNCIGITKLSTKAHKMSTSSKESKGGGGWKVSPVVNNVAQRFLYITWSSPASSLVGRKNWNITAKTFHFLRRISVHQNGIYDKWRIGEFGLKLEEGTREISQRMDWWIVSKSAPGG